MDGTLFDDRVQSCNWDFDVTCLVETCEPTGKPTQAPTTSYPSSYPSVEGSEWPSHAPSWEPSAAPTYNFFYTMETNTMKLAIQDTVLVAYNANGIAYPTTRYTYDGMISALKEMADGIVSDGREFRLYVGKEEANLQYGRANLAAFLAMAMTESIAYDTCDEFNSDQVAGKYAISNSCGQNGRSYQDEVCTVPSEVKMSCNVDNDMVMVSASTAISQGGRPPPPLKCGPKEDWSDYAGYWDSRTGEASDNPYANALGRIDIEGCKRMSCVCDEFIVSPLWDLLLHFFSQRCLLFVLHHSPVLFQVAGKYFFHSLLSGVAHDRSSLCFLFPLVLYT